MTDQEKIRDMELQIATLLSDQKYLLRKNEDQWVRIQELTDLLDKIHLMSCQIEKQSQIIEGMAQRMDELQDIDVEELFAEQQDARLCDLLKEWQGNPMKKLMEAPEPVKAL
tara:strand:- start:82 stop:417 length:336 start_codon:yes stop_codon:yes gene_type:complete